MKDYIAILESYMIAEEGTHVSAGSNNNSDAITLKVRSADTYNEYAEYFHQAVKLACTQKQLNEINDAIAFIKSYLPKIRTKITQDLIAIKSAKAGDAIEYTYYDKMNDMIEDKMRKQNSATNNDTIVDITNRKTELAQICQLLEYCDSNEIHDDKSFANINLVKDYMKANKSDLDDALADLHIKYWRNAVDAVLTSIWSLGSSLRHIQIQLSNNK